MRLRRFVVGIAVSVAPTGLWASPAHAINEGDPCSTEGLRVVEGGHVYECKRVPGFGGTGLVWKCIGFVGDGGDYG